MTAINLRVIKSWSIPSFIPGAGHTQHTVLVDEQLRADTTTTLASRDWPGRFTSQTAAIDASTNQIELSFVSSFYFLTLACVFVYVRWYSGSSVIN